MNLISAKWPLIYEKELKVINNKKSIAIGTMWTLIENIDTLLKNTTVYHKINTIGNTYSLKSVLGIIINLSANRYIRHLVITGDIMVYQNVVTLLGEVFNGDSVEDYMDLYKDYLKDMRVQICTCKYVEEKDIIDYIDSLEELPPYEMDVINIKEELSKISESSYYPSDISGYTLRCLDGNLFNTFLDINRVIQTRGYSVNNTREVQNMTIVIYKMNISTVYKIPNITEELVKEYQNDMMNPINKSKSYTYGQLLHKNKEYLINLLKSNPSTRQAYVCLFNESFYGHELPPCAVSVYFRILKDILHMSIVFRSNDMFKAWILNIIGFRHFQTILADILSLKVGTTTTISHSAHIYEDDFNDSIKLLNEHSYTRTNVIPEPEGYYLVKRPDDVDDKIEVTLCNNDDEPIKVWTDTDYEQLIYTVTSNINNSMHAAEIARVITITRFNNDKILC